MPRHTTLTRTFQPHNRFCICHVSRITRHMKAKAWYLNPVIPSWTQWFGIKNMLYNCYLHQEENQSFSLLLQIEGSKKTEKEFECFVRNGYLEKQPHEWCSHNDFSLKKNDKKSEIWNATCWYNKKKTKIACRSSRQLMGTLSLS